MNYKPKFLSVALIALFAFGTSAVSFASTSEATAVGINQGDSFNAENFRPKKKKAKKRKKCEAYGG